MDGGSEQAVAVWAVGTAERGMLDDMYGSTVKRPANLGRDPNAPVWEMYQVLWDALDRKVTWEEARERVDSLIGAYPEHGEAQKLGPFIRDRQLPEWRRKSERPW